MRRASPWSPSIRVALPSHWFFRFSLALAAIFIVLFPGSAYAHIGEQNVVFEGTAGPYPLRVIIKAPSVVPGLAEITIRSLAPGVDSATVLPLRWDVGRKGSPPPDKAKPVPGEPDLFSAQLWLMTSGAYSVEVSAKGARGEHSLLVPVNSVATARLGLPNWLGGALAVLGVLLMALMITVARAAAQESILNPGETPSPMQRRRGLRSALVATLIIGLSLWGGRRWWKAEENQYLTRMLFEPFQVGTSLETINNQQVLRLAVDFSKGPSSFLRNVTPLIPDHGKLMHVFVVRTNGLDAMAHLHPVRISPGAFTAALPPLPAGAYRLFADVTHESGFSHTMVGTFEIQQPTMADAFQATDPDDAWSASGSATPTAFQIKLAGDGRFTSGKDAGIAVQAVGSNGKPVELEPYLGMLGHAFVMAEDGTVFSHLHPQGNGSMGAAIAFTRRELGTSAAQKLAEDICAPLGPDRALGFPYVFPKPGNYRLWVQAKAGGKVETGNFRIEVK